MIVTFNKEYLKELYEQGKSGDKKHRFQPDIVRRYKRCIDIMIDTPDIVSLGKYVGLNLEKLSGDKKKRILFCKSKQTIPHRVYSG